MIMFAIMLYNGCSTKNRDLAIFATLWLVILDREMKEKDD